MGNFIVEYIGINGLKHSEYNHYRAKTPRPGDFVDFGENIGTYPFTHGRYGRIDSIDAWNTPGAVSICCQEGSCYLSDGSVSISGGPFTTVIIDQLEQTMELHAGRFWNFGNNLPGGGQGVDYTITRPVFRLRKMDDTEKARVSSLLFPEKG